MVEDPNPPYKLVIAPSLARQLEELGILDQARDAIRSAMSDPEQAGKQLTDSFYPYRRLKPQFQPLPDRLPRGQ